MNASELITQYGTANPFELAKIMEIDVHITDVPDFIIGFGLWDDDITKQELNYDGAITQGEHGAIIINKSLAPSMQEFVCAYSIHQVLNHQHYDELYEGNVFHQYREKRHCFCTCITRGCGIIF